MDQRKLQGQIGRLLVFLGATGLVLSFVGEGFLGSAVGGLFTPGLILLFIGRAVSRRAQRSPIDDVLDPPSPLEELRRLRESKPAPKRPVQQDPKPKPKPTPRPKPTLPEREKINADLEKALAEYRTHEDGAEPIEPMIEPLIDPGEFRPKSSAERIEAAKQRLREKW